MSFNIIFESLVSCRNILFNNKSSEYVISTLHSVLDLIENISIKHSKNILIYCINQAVDQVNNGNFKSAGIILNLIHNLPLNDEDFLKWKIDYFLSVEVVNFLDEFENVKNSRNIALYIFDEISKLYPPKI